MIYIRKIFKQDLRDGKQIAFPKEPSNAFFNFSFSNGDPERRITFKYIEKDSNSSNIQYNNRIIATRLYAAGSESRIDGELKQFLRDNLSASIGDIILFRSINLSTYEFEYIPTTSGKYEIYSDILRGGNHEVAVSQGLVYSDNPGVQDVKQIIFYGAPGTGKSFKVDQEIKDLDPKFYERVTFHPEFDNSSFIGGYRPKTIRTENDEKSIVYEFVPQAFARIYARAWKDLENHYFLVVEEINRGNCAEIFGDIFQLLDRSSGYTVSPSEEFYQYLLEEFGNSETHSGIIKGLNLPPNLSIYATMNTSDQSLFPMDSAFKRRWDWEYIPICYEKNNEEGEPNASYSYLIQTPDGDTYSWIDFIHKINNDHIKENLSLGMDKCIGNYFVKPAEGNIINTRQFINKVIFYLWNDVFRDEENSVFESKGSYEDFFPIPTNGLKKVKELFERIKLEPIADDDSAIDVEAEGNTTEN